MELEDDDFDAYELDATGMIIKSPGNGAPAAAPREVRVHRSGSIDISAAAGYGRSNNRDNRNNRNNTNGAAAAAAATAAGSSTAASYNAQLATKVRAQASDLQRLGDELDAAYGYARLCERRVCELHPNHPIPVTEDCLGVANPAGSGAGGSKIAARGGGTGKSARLRRENAELAHSNNALEKQLRTARSKLTDVSRNLKETRLQSERKDRELAYREKRIAKLEAQIAESSSSATNAPSSSSPSAARGSPSRGTTSPSANLLPGEGAAEVANMQLRKEVAALRQSLQNEARTSEEQRVYIKVLESAVQSKAGEMGLQPGQASLLTKLARLEGQLQSKQREQEAANAAVNAMEAEMEDLRKRENGTAVAAAAQQEQIRSLSDRLSQFGRGEDELLSSVQTLESEKTALLDYVQENVARTAELTHQVQALESDKVRMQKELRDAESALRQQLGTATQNSELLRLKLSEGEATVASLKEDTSSLRRELQQEQHEREKADESNRSLTADVEELREVQNELLETIREKTKAVSKATREVTALQREKDASEGEVATLQSKIQMLQLRMEAQKDLLRQDASAAVASLESELATAVGAHEACKQELNGAEARAAKLEKDLRIAEGDVDMLERTRDQLTAERDEQATRLDTLESAQEQSERDVDELQEALSAATSELMELREVRAACNRIRDDLVHMRGLREIEEAAKMAEDSGGAFTVEVVVVEGKGETTVVTPSRKSKSKSGGSGSGKGKPASAQALAERLAAWCRGDNTARQLKLATLPLLARGVSVLGSQFEANAQSLERTVREMEVVRRSLQEEIFSLRSQLETTRDSETRLSEAEVNHKAQIRDLSEELKDANNECARTSADLDRAEASGESLRMLLEDRERALGSTEETLARAQNDLETRTCERDEALTELGALRDTHLRLKGEHAMLGEEATRHKDEVEMLRKDVATRRKDFAALQEGHLRDREVLHEKISRSEANETRAFEKAQSLGVQVAQLEAKVSSMSALLADESTTSERASGELRQLRDELHVASADRERLTAQLEADRRSNAAEKDTMETRNAGLEARLRALKETKGITDSTVVSLTTEVESIRRTILRAVDDVCSRYGHESQPIAGFAANRDAVSPGRRSRSNSPSRNSAATPGRSIAAPQIEGVRDAVRQMSALLHSLAAGSVTQHNLEASQLATARSQSTATAAELRRAQELLSHARAQHAGVVRTSSANLESERERNRQLEALVERLRRETSQQGGSLGELQARCASLDGQIITFHSDIASLRMQLEQSNADAAMLRDESSDKDATIAQLRSDLETSRSELDALEVQVTSDLTSLASQHTESIERSNNLRVTLEEAQSELRVAKSSLKDANARCNQLNREIVQQQEDFAARMQERMSSAQVELQSLKQRLADSASQVEQVRTKSEFELEQLRSELGGSEATVGMLREQNEQLQEQHREAVAEAHRASEALNGQESLCRAERVQNEALEGRVAGLESELSRMRRLAAERGIVASNRSMEISELRGSLSRVENALDSSPQGKGASSESVASGDGLDELYMQTPGATPMGGDDARGGRDDGHLRVHRTGSVSFNNTATRSFQQSGPIRAMPMRSIETADAATGGPTTSVAGVANIHVSRRGSINITTNTPNVRPGGGRRVGPSPAAARVRERLSAVRAQFASMR